jgi:MGT family glycosyltransferase
MSRFLFVVPPLTGHTLPTVAVGRELTARGHDVAWAGHADVIGRLLPTEARLIDVGGGDGTRTMAEIQARSRGLRGAAAFRFLWEDFLIPLATAMVPGVEGAVEEFRPDALVVDQQALAGALVARRRLLPWATSATTSAELTDPFALMPKLAEWATFCLLELQRGYGVPDAEARRGDLRFSDHLVLAFTTEALVGPVDQFGDQYAFVGPSIGVRPAAPDFPFEWLDISRRLVLASLGTVSRDIGGRFFQTVLDAVAPLGETLQVVLVAPPDVVPDPPEHVLVREFVPQLDLIAQADAVISHAGHNTVCESLAHGVPLVVAPIRDDQPVIAQQVVDAGAGIRVRYGRVGPLELRSALLDVLDDRAYRTAARRVGASFGAAGGAAAAADRLERLT